MKLSYLSVMPIASYETGYVEGKNLCKATVKYCGHNGEICLYLGPEFATLILALVADQMVKGSQEIAQRLTSEVIDAANPTVTFDASKLVAASDL